MHGISKTKKILLALIILNVLALGIYAYFFFSIQNKLTYIDEQSVAAQEQITARSNRAEIKKILEERVSEREKISRQFIDFGKEVEFAIALESLGQRSGVDYEYELKVVDPQIQDPKNKTPYTLLQVVVKTEGAWNDTVQFLSLIEAYERYIQIDSYELSVVETGNEVPEGTPSVWRGAFAITAFIERE